MRFILPDKPSCWVSDHDGNRKGVENCIKSCFARANGLFGSHPFSDVNRRHYSANDDSPRVAYWCCREFQNHSPLVTEFLDFYPLFSCNFSVQDCPAECPLVRLDPVVALG